MAVKKAKAPAIEVPQSDEEANALLAQYGETFNYLARASVDLDAALAKIKADCEAAAKPMQTKLDDIVEALAAYGAANRKRLTENGEIKTVKMPAGEIGWRKNPPSVKWQRGFKEEDVLFEILKLRLKKFLRRKVSVNKQALLDDPDKAAEIPGVRIVKDVEEFFVAPFGAELAEPKE